MRVASLASHGGLPHRKATHYQETVLRIKDGFPKLKDAPGNQEAVMAAATAAVQVVVTAVQITAALTVTAAVMD